MTLKYTFPNDFWWGSASSATQIEGSDNGIKGKDIKNMKQTGHNSFRLSISWSRLIPGGKGEVNQQAVDFYRDVIDQLLAHEIEPFVNLFHFDMPYPLQELGGWENRQVIDAYLDYATIAFELFGDRVKKWFTFNEP